MPSQTAGGWCGRARPALARPGDVPERVDVVEADDRQTRLGEQVAVNRHPGTATMGQTGALPPQGESAA